MRGLWSTIALVLVLAGLGAYIFFVESNNPAPGVETKAKVFSVTSDEIAEVRVTTGDATTVLVKKDSGWTITEPTATEADPTETSSLVTNISSLEVNRVVDENAADLAMYGLAEPAIKVAFKAGDKSGEVHFGKKTPTQGDVYAVQPGEKKVFLVSSYLETTFDKKPFDLRDKRAVKFERDKVDSVQIARDGRTIRLSRAGSEWKVDEPLAGRADYSAVEGLLTRLSTAAMAEIVEPQATSLTKYGLEKPEMSITLGAGSSQTVLDVGRTSSASSASSVSSAASAASAAPGRYARDKSRPMVFTLDTTLADDLSKAFDEYRKKDLFEFRPFNVSRVRVTRTDGTDTRTYEFEKTSSPEGDKWRVTPEGSEARDVDTAKADDLLNKLTALRATGFVDKPAASAPARTILNVGVSYDNGKFERVRVGPAAGTVHQGAREGEATVAEVDKAAVDAALQSLDQALAPPAPAQPAPAPPTDGKK